MRHLHCLLVIVASLSLGACKEKNTELKETMLRRSMDSGREVQFFWLEPKSGAAPWPVLIYLHGRQDKGKGIGGRAFYDWGILQSAAKKGYLPVAISLPGYGKSDGPQDFSGPDSLQAVADVIRALRKRPEIAADRIAIYGVSLGAVVAARVAESVAGLAGVVLVSGTYDMRDSYQTWKNSSDPEARFLAESFEREAGLSDLAFRERSVLPEPQIRFPVLAFNGGRDPFTSAMQTEQLVRKLKSKGIDARAVLFRDTGHHVPVDARDQEIEPFLRQILGR